MKAPFYITTPIYYVNDRPHIGHCYTTLLADVAARFHRLVRGEPNPDNSVTPSPAAPSHSVTSSVFLLTGTDEHADKVVTSAASNGVTPQEWADRNAAEFQKAFAFINSSHDDFIRTTEPRHKDKVVGYIKRLQASGDIYKGEYTGWYDAGQEEYVTETAARENQYKSPINGKPLVKRTEPCYFFRLSKYQPHLLDLISDAQRQFVRPESRRQEVLGRLRPPALLHDVPVSRPVTDDPATQWGIRVPGDDAHRIYVWIDALFNYLTVVDTPERKHYWPASVHLLGKDILWFHAVIWPALLTALKLTDCIEKVELPRTVFGHGWWIAEGQKMSKSLGNFIDLEKMKAYAARYSLDALRWYLTTQGPMSGSDADFSHAKFVEVYNADLANGIGNCASRVGNMIEKYFGGALPDARGVTSNAGSDWPATVGRAVMIAISRADALELGGVVGAGLDIVRAVDGYINTTAPFKLAKTVEANPKAKDELAVILYHCAEALRIASILLSPAMPTKMAHLQRTWHCEPASGVPLADLAVFGGKHALKPGQQIAKGEALFMRADPAEPAPAAAPS